MGNLTRDPELSYTPQGSAVCKFGLAVNNTFTTSAGVEKKDALFVDIDVWKKQGENCATYLKKGSLVFVEGRLRLDTWQSQSGEKRSKIKVVAIRVQFLGARQKTAGLPGDNVPSAGDNDKLPPEHAAGEDNEMPEE